MEGDFTNDWVVGANGGDVANHSARYDPDASTDCSGTTFRYKLARALG